MSVIIFSAAEICRRSRATGCCCNSSFQAQRLDVALLAVDLRIERRDLRASFGVASVSACEARAMTSSHSAPISISSG